MNVYYTHHQQNIQEVIQQKFSNSDVLCMNLHKISEEDKSLMMFLLTSMHIEYPTVNEILILEDDKSSLDDILEYATTDTTKIPMAVYSKGKLMYQK